MRRRRSGSDDEAAARPHRRLRRPGRCGSRSADGDAVRAVEREHRARDRGDEAALEHRRVQLETSTSSSANHARLCTCIAAAERGQSRPSSVCVSDVIGRRYALVVWSNVQNARPSPSARRCTCAGSSQRNKSIGALPGRSGLPAAPARRARCSRRMRNRSRSRARPARARRQSPCRGRTIHSSLASRRRSCPARTAPLWIAGDSGAGRRLSSRRCTGHTAMRINVVSATLCDLAVTVDRGLKERHACAARCTRARPCTPNAGMRARLSRYR